MADDKKVKIDEKALQAAVTTAAAPAGHVDVATIKAIMAELVPAVTAAVIAANQTKNQQPPQKPTCLKCGQKIMACGDQHRETVVYVTGPYERWFQGCQINGVVYKSPGPGRRITVPADLNEGHMMEEFRKAEERFATSKTWEHHSGEISPNSDKGFRSTQSMPVHHTDL